MSRNEPHGDPNFETSDRHLAAEHPYPQQTTVREARSDDQEESAMRDDNPILLYVAFIATVILCLGVMIADTV